MEKLLNQTGSGVTGGRVTALHRDTQATHITHYGENWDLFVSDTQTISSGISQEQAVENCLRQPNQRQAGKAPW